MPELTYREKAVAVLQSIETGDPRAFAYINPNRYVQHNLSLPDGVQGIAGVLRSQPVGSFKASVLRAFEDGDHVFTHTAYDFFGPKVGFDVFRFEQGLIVEHWDNLMPVQPANKSGRTLIDGSCQIGELDRSAANKHLVKKFFTDNILNGAGTFTQYIDPAIAQHNPDGADGLQGLAEMMVFFTSGARTMRYDKIHKVLGEGNFVLLMSEGLYGPGGGAPTSFYDLFRVDNGKLVEHWDVLEPIPPRGQWQNGNGKF
jgi:predicted SnoaL-like aldol condensation-catalyzing enzyme